MIQFPGKSTAHTQIDTGDKLKWKKREKNGIESIWKSGTHKTQMEVIFSILINAKAGVSDVWINEKIEFMLARIG